MRRAIVACALAAAMVVPALLTSARVPAAASFDPVRAAAPLWSAGHGKQALALLGRRDHAGCARELALMTTAEAAAPEAMFLLGYCRAKAGDAAGALTILDGLGDRLPLLADYTRLISGEALLALGRDDEAAARVRAIASGSPLRAEAELTLGAALDHAGKNSEAADVYAGYLRAYPGSWRAGEVRGRLAVALDRAGRAAEAATTWREVSLESPISLGPRAEPHLDPTRPLSAEELARRATVLFDAMRNKESELAWIAVLAAPDVTPALACRARYHVGQSVWKQRDRARSAPLFEAAIEPCIAAGDADLAAKSLYQAGRAHGSRAEKDKAAGEQAIALYARLMKEYAAHSYADDAALRRADVLDTLLRGDEASAALAEIPDKFPSGDQRGEALFRLAFRAFERRDFAAAQRWLEKELALLPREEGWWEAGRTLYWLARSQDAQAQPAAAIASYERAVREYPLSFYALLAANRLIDVQEQRGDPRDVADRLLTELAADPAPPRAATTDAPGAIADRPIFHSPGFARALLLLRMGLGAEARRELTAAGLEAPRKGAPVPADRELGWATSLLFEAAGDWAASHAYGRYVDTSYARHWPAGSGELPWRLSFPRAYAALVEEAVKATHQPAALELAIMREESAFDPNLESFANAVGLTQLTAAPAQRFAQGLPHDAQALRDPAINLAIGARELGQLWTDFEGNAALAIASYNAGEGAVRRWLRDPDNKDRELDEFIERIPYDETRGYTKRVLGTFFAYRWLEGAKSAIERVPRMRWTLAHKKR